jgi:3-dehydrosphinganine reductase
MRFAGLPALITGGSSGIGRALALQLARRGAHVHLAARRQAPLEAALAALEAERQGAEQVFSAYPLDVTDADQARRVVEELAQQGMAPQLVVNCAGAVEAGYFDETAPEVYRRLIEVNYLGAVHVCQAAAPYLRGGGHVLNVATGAAFLPLPGYAAYVGSKSALVGFSEVLRYELRPRGIGVSVAYPKDTDTPQYHADLAIRSREINAISGLSSVMSAEQAARLILRGVQRGAFHIPLGTDTAIIFRLLRPLEWAKFLVLDAMLAVIRRRGWGTPRE